MRCVRILGYNAINAIESAFDSNYNSLQVGFAQAASAARAWPGLSYTWSKNLTDNASDRSNAPQNSYNWHEGEYGPATLDRTQVFTANYVYTIPFFAKAHGLEAVAAEGLGSIRHPEFLYRIALYRLDIECGSGGAGPAGKQRGSGATRPGMRSDGGRTPHRGRVVQHGVLSAHAAGRRCGPATRDAA